MKIREWQVGSETDRPIIRGYVKYATTEELEAEKAEFERRRNPGDFGRWLERKFHLTMEGFILLCIFVPLIVAGIVAAVINGS